MERAKMICGAIRISHLLCALGLVLVLSGCGTTNSVAKSEGKGIRRTYRVGYETAWMATRGAIANNDLRVIKLDRKSGTILAKRGIGMTTFGEHVGVWVRYVGPDLTSVEVVGRHVGPPVLPGQNPQQPILDDISTML